MATNIGKDMDTPNHKIKMMVRLDANHTIGLGHAARISELLKHFQTPTEIHVFGCGEQVPLLFDDSIIIHTNTDETSSSIELANECVSIAQKINADAILVDQPFQSKEDWEIYNESAFPIIAIDDYGGDVMADLIFNGTLLEEYHRYPLVSNTSQVYCGRKYTMINPIFSNMSKRIFDEKKLLIVIGSGERAKEWAVVLTGRQNPMKDIQFDDISMIVGGAFPCTEKLQKACERHGIDLHQNIPQDKLADLMSRHSIALITGGTVVFEAMASGCPAIVFPQELNMIPEANWFAQNDAALNLEYDGGMDMKLVQNALKDLISNKSKAERLSKNAAKLIDGMGIIRVAKEIDQFLTTVTMDT